MANLPQLRVSGLLKARSAFPLAVIVLIFTGSCRSSKVDSGVDPLTTNEGNVNLSVVERAIMHCNRNMKPPQSTRTREVRAGNGDLIIFWSQNVQSSLDVSIVKEYLSPLGAHGHKDNIPRNGALVYRVENVTEVVDTTYGFEPDVSCPLQPEIEIPPRMILSP